MNPIICPRCNKPPAWGTSLHGSRGGTRPIERWCDRCKHHFTWTPEGIPFETCPGCQEQIKKGGMKKHWKSESCQAVTMGAFARACGYTNNSHHQGIPEELTVRLRTSYRRMAWGRGGARTEWWVPMWAVALNESLMAMQGGEAWDYDNDTQWDAWVKEREALILATANDPPRKEE